MRPFARRVVAYVRSVGSNPTLSFECFVSQNELNLLGGDSYITHQLTNGCGATGPRMIA